MRYFSMQTKTKLLLGLAAALLVVTVGYFTYPLYFPDPQPRQEPLAFSDLSGTLYLTLHTTAANQTRLRTLTFPDTEKLGRIGNAEFAMTAAVAPDGRTMAYAKYPDPKQQSGPLQLYTQAVAPISAAPAPAQITRSKTYLKRVPDWSPDGRQIAFMAQPQAETLSFEPHDWSVYVTDLQGNERRISDGEYPKWSKDGEKLVFVRDDGLYLYDLSAPPESALQKLWDGDVTSSMKLSISPSRDLVAWTSLGQKEIVLLKIDFKNKMGKEVKRLASPSYWTAFSPDGRYLAVQETSDDHNRGWLSVISLETGEKKKVRDLAAFDQKKMFLTDWK